MTDTFATSYLIVGLVHLQAFAFVLKCFREAGAQLKETWAAAKQQGGSGEVDLADMLEYMEQVVEEGIDEGNMYKRLGSFYQSEISRLKKMWVDTK